MAASSSSSSCIYEVFLSFRGEDTRKSFTCHLYENLYERKNIKTFIDDEELRRGDEISPALLNAIQGSKISVVIFSKDYASSKWCLNELVKILECKNTNGQIIIPVFYRVSPSDVRHQTGVFGDGFYKLEQQFKEKPVMVQKWRVALTETTYLAGHESTKFRHDAELVNKIVDDVLTKLEKITVSTDSSNGLVGLNSRIEQIKPFLCMDLWDTVQIVGIWGMGGIGKTTLAEAIFDQFSGEFDGSRIVVTTRDKGVLENFEVEEEKIYGVNGLEFDEAFKHFCNFAFKEKHCPEDFKRDSRRVVEYAHGNPLVLKVLGSSLKRKSHWGNISGKITRLYLDQSAIEEVPSSIECLTDLEVLDLRGCKRLKRISTRFCKLRSLVDLFLHGCLNLESFPEILEKMEHLKRIYLGHTTITELPSSFENLPGLEVLFVDDCSKLDKLPDNIGNFESLYHISAAGSAIRQLPSSVADSNALGILEVSNCKGSQSTRQPKFTSSGKSNGIEKPLNSSFSKAQTLQHQ
ncbi:hypothetical protein WN944_015854 [Citrus x changshan-huyou]|uniref:TIR domain-containing protein n=1 Tax=Citrus x changshan-huyou TaxID=2935761 RepID=A0AAP0M8A1_9ROSI